MSDTGALRKDAQQLDISTVKEKLKEFEGILQTKQQDLKLSYAALQSINVISIKTHMEHLEEILNYLDTLPSNLTPEEGEKLAAKTGAIASLEKVNLELATVLANCQRLELLAKKYGKDEADDVNTTITHRNEHIQNCRRPLIQAEGQIHKLRNLLS